MSRHIVRSDGSYEVVAGWDPPLHTFFVLVYDVHAFEQALAEDENADYVIVLWRGFESGEIPTPEDAAELVRPWAIIPDRLLVALRRDKEERR